MECDGKCEMYERMLDMQASQIAFLQQELRTLHESLLCKQHTRGQATKTNVDLKLPFFKTVVDNIQSLDESTVTRKMSNSYPACFEIFELLQECINGPHTTDALFNVSTNNFVSYLADDMTLTKEDYTALLAKVFKLLLGKCKKVCTNVHENVTSEATNTLSDNCHDNMMMLTSNNSHKSKLQKDILRLMKHNAFSNK